MSLILPRLDRESAVELIERHRHSAPEAISAVMPELSPVVTYSPVGGNRIHGDALADLRTAVVAIAAEHGFPNSTPRERLQLFEGRAARLIHERLEMTPHEASQEEVWSYITCCWLLDVAMWRFDAAKGDERFIGHLNRNTFRRMWWRAEVLGREIDLTLLGEDELVNIMERPTLFSDRRLARAIAVEFLDRVERQASVERMKLMREATKRVLRLTPFVASSALDEGEVRRLVSEAFDAASAGIAGQTAPALSRPRVTSPAPSPEVEGIPAMTMVSPDTGPAESSKVRSEGISNFEEVASAAMDLARRTGRVTNIALREVVPISSDEAREVFRVLMDRGALVRRGVRRGTHYIVPELEVQPGTPDQPRPDPPARPSASPSSTTPSQPPRVQRPSETALRRLLRRGR